MLTILFISDDTRVADLVARFQPKLKARMRLARDFDEGLKEVFDNRPAAVFIQGEISGISGETVARHIKTLLRADAPRIVLMHTAPLLVQGAKKWFDDTVDFSLPSAELLEQFGRRLREIAPAHWLDRDDVPAAPAAGNSGTETVYAAPAGPSPSGEPDPFDWESPASSVFAAAPSPPPRPVSGVSGGERECPLEGLLPSPADTGEGGEASGEMLPEVPVRDVMPSIIEETKTAQSLSAQRPEPPPVERPAEPSSPREAAPKAATPPASPPPAEKDDLEERFAALLSDFSAEQPTGRTAEWVTIPPPDETDGSSGRRLTLWAIAIVGLLVGAVVGGSLLLKDKGITTEKPSGSGKALAPPTAPSAPAPVPASKSMSAEHAAPAAQLPSFVPRGGKDRGYGKAHPGWERYFSDGIEYRLFREGGKLKAVQILARRGRPIPEALLETAVRELTGSGSPVVSSRTKKGGYRRESGRIEGKGEVVVYRKNGGIRGIVVTLA
uniref:Uncharacterized protein n=1 Tax=Geobacter metallireducens TaxID=28232 RepID=A0A831XDN6_GEOME